ncbi:MAG: hypothetical protein ABEJ68_01640 [Halobacteriaceae archaeon]
MERDALEETAVGIGGVLLFVAAAFVIGVQYTETPTDGGQLLQATGAYGLVAAIAGFVLLMSLLGVWLSRD